MKGSSFPLGEAVEAVEERLSFEVVKVHDVLEEKVDVVVVDVPATMILRTCLKCNLLHFRLIRQRIGHCPLKVVLADELDS